MHMFIVKILGVSSYGMGKYQVKTKRRLIQALRLHNSKLGVFVVKPTMYLKSLYGEASQDQSEEHKLALAPDLLSFIKN